MNNLIIPNIKIGVLQSGRLINELIIDELQDVTIGRSLDNTITIDEINFHEKMPFLVYSKGIYYLNVYRGASGKIFEGQKILSLSDIPEHPDVIKKGDLFCIPLSNDIRGIINIGKETILFKIYPSEPIPDQLPKEFRGGLITSDFDYSFFGILAIFLVSYLLVVHSFSKVKMREQIKFEQIPDRFAKLIMNAPDPFKTKKIEQVGPESKAPAKSEESKSEDHKELKQETQKITEAKKQHRFKEHAKRNPVGIKPGPGGGNDSYPRNTKEIVRSAGIIGIIGSKGEGGTVANLFRGNEFNDKLNKALKGVSGLKAATSINESKMKRGAGDAKGIEVGTLKSVTGSGLVAFGSNTTSANNVLGSIGEKDIEGDGKMNPNVIAKILAQHIGAFQYCYNKSLQNNPKLSGELKVRFMIMLDGSVNKKDIMYAGPASKDAELTSCIGRVFSRIKFPQPSGGDVIVNYPLNFMSQN